MAVVQLQPLFLDLDRNLEKALDMLHHLSVDLVVFPELFLSGYTFKSREEVMQISLPLDANRYIAPLLEMSREKSMGICGGYAEKDGANLYNSAFFIGDGKILDNYRKIHLFKDEKKYFNPGDGGFRVFGYKGMNIGVMICFDWIFPESARSLALKGAQLILHPANLVLPYCQQAMFARAIENRVFIITANRVGREVNGDYDNRFTGGSQVVSPRGDYLLQMGSSDEGTESVEIDPTLALDKQLTRFNDLFGDRKPQWYVNK